jgi:hypothetical protein
MAGNENVAMMNERIKVQLENNIRLRANWSFLKLLASIGSVNFHHNATGQGYESTSICMDDYLNKQLDRILVQDMANSIPLIFSSLQ